MAMTYRSFDEPSVTQFSIYLKNRVGELLELTSTLTEARIEIYGLSVFDATDHAVVRVILSDPPWAAKTLKEHHYATTKSELIGVCLPDRPDPVGAICRALMEAEVNIHYLYPLFCRPFGRPILVIHSDDHPTGSRVLVRKGYDLIHHGHLREEGGPGGPTDPERN